MDVNQPLQLLGGVSPQLFDRRTKMLLDARHIFIYKESFRASGRDAKLMRRLSVQRCLSPKDLALTSTDARCLLQAWSKAGWLHGI